MYMQERGECSAMQAVQDKLSLALREAFEMQRALAAT